MEAKQLTPPSPGARKPRARKPQARPQSLEAVVKARIKGDFTVRIDVDTVAMLAAIAKEAGLRGKSGIQAVIEQVIQSGAESAREPGLQGPRLSPGQARAVAEVQDEPAAPIRSVREPRRGDG